MKKFRLVLIFALAAWVQSPAIAQSIDPNEIVERARATIGSPEALDGVVTLDIVGSLEPANPYMPDATIAILARRPDSQRLELRVDDMVETTIVNGDDGCIVRSSLSAGASRMRPLSVEELERVRYSTRQFFNFYKPDFRSGEQLSYDGVVTHRGERAHRLVYTYPDGYKTIRFFSVDTDRLTAFISDNGVESIYVGEQIVDGIKYPDRIDYFEGEKKLHSIVFREIKVNRPLPPGIFRIPEGNEN